MSSLYKNKTGGRVMKKQGKKIIAALSAAAITVSSVPLYPHL